MAGAPAFTPAWLLYARQDIGVRELKGAPTNERIAAWLYSLGAWWRDDETPWCGLAVAAWMQATGHPLPNHWYRARAWLQWGTPLSSPAQGCVVVFERDGGGHVGLVEAMDDTGRLLVLGGNQRDAVSVAPFETSRVLGYRWPPAIPLPSAPLKVIASRAASSTNEA